MRIRRNAPGPIYVVVLSIASLLSFCVPPASAAPPSLACRYVEAGVAGPVGNLLEIDGTGNVAIARDGEQIVVYEAKSIGWLKERKIECSGGVPTVTTVDRVAYDAPPDLGQILIDERDGRLEPGATDEPAGDDEIEVSIQIPQTGEHRPNVHVLGTAGPDLVAAADLRGERVGINLNVRHDRAYRDADVIISKPRRAIVKIDGYGGADRLLATGAAGGAGFLGPLSLSSLVLLGGEGEDFLLGGFKGDHLEGEGGDDLIVGRGGRDFVFAGSGRDEVRGGRGGDWIWDAHTNEDDTQLDLLAGGRGNDHILSGRGVRDRVLCGSGFDEVWVDPFDHWTGHGCDEAHVSKLHRPL
jgi:RTX calcium-binding nonapeptide repeat (4 copies)